jgi:hypothetical protein
MLTVAVLSLSMSAYFSLERGTQVGSRLLLITVLESTDAEKIFRMCRWHLRLESFVAESSLITYCKRSCLKLLKLGTFAELFFPRDSLVPQMRTELLSQQVLSCKSDNRAANCKSVASSNLFVLIPLPVPLFIAVFIAFATGRPACCCCPHISSCSSAGGATFCAEVQITHGGTC